MFSSSHIKHRLCISFMKGGERWQYSSTKQFSSSNRINAEVFNCSWKMRRVCGETVTLCETMMCTAAVAVCELENNIYRASHLASFITKSHTPASPMKLGVNPSSASLFSPSPLPHLIQAYTSHPLTFTLAKDTKGNFGVIQK